MFNEDFLNNNAKSGIDEYDTNDNNDMIGNTNPLTASRMTKIQSQASIGGYNKNIQTRNGICVGGLGMASDDFEASHRRRSASGVFSRGSLPATPNGIGASHGHVKLRDIRSQIDALEREYRDFENI